MRLKPSSARLPAFSISSRQSRMTSGLRRVSTPATPMAKMNAESTMYQVMSKGLVPGAAVGDRVAGALGGAGSGARGLGLGAAQDRRLGGTGRRSDRTGGLPGRLGQPAALAREHDRADGGDRQQNRRDLERDQELLQEQ